MFLRIRKRLAVMLLVLCYASGQMVFPIYAESSIDDTLFDALLAEREELSTEETNAPEKVKVSIDDFADVRKNDWFYPYLEYLVSNGLINGKTPTAFEPQSTFSYAECSAVIVRYLGLEDEAAKRMKRIAERDPTMKGIWYAGYFEVMASLGLFADYGLFECEDGHLISIDEIKANSPVVRYRFADSISESFELESDLKARNTYSEMGGSGREFIIGGGYKEDILYSYEAYISDYLQIPEEARVGVLKSYYNGIFNGDVSGNFYPENNLTRAEMAKVLATISDMTLRTRLITEGYGEHVDDSKLFTDPAGDVTLGYEVWEELLRNEAENLVVNNGTIEYKSGASAPAGYAIDAYLYIGRNGEYVLTEECTLRDGNDGSFTYMSDDARVLLVLRNTLCHSRPEGVLDIRINGGNIESINTTVRES